MNCSRIGEPSNTLKNHFATRPSMGARKLHQPRLRRRAYFPFKPYGWRSHEPLKIYGPMHGYSCTLIIASLSADPYLLLGATSRVWPKLALFALVGTMVPVFECTIYIGEFCLRWL